MINLGINIDHIATVRNARGENDPSLLEMLFEIEAGGAHTITAHLREDRRHIKDEDIIEVKKHTKLPVNLEMALTSEMIKIAVELQPSSVCVVPEKREEITTEGGLDIKTMVDELTEAQIKFKKNNIEFYLFLEPTEDAVYYAKQVGATGVEVHTGGYAHTFQNKMCFKREVFTIKNIAKLCAQEGLVFHAGHGLNYYNIQPLLEIKNLTEVNIGHAIIAHALKVGLRNAVQKMAGILNNI